VREGASIPSHEYLHPLLWSVYDSSTERLTSSSSKLTHMKFPLPSRASLRTTLASLVKLSLEAFSPVPIYVGKSGYYEMAQPRLIQRHDREPLAITLLHHV
jgi:hypothetical protein